MYSRNSCLVNPLGRTAGKFGVNAYNDMVVLSGSKKKRTQKVYNDNKADRDDVFWQAQRVVPPDSSKACPN